MFCWHLAHGSWLSCWMMWQVYRGIALTYLPSHFIPLWLIFRGCRWPWIPDWRVWFSGLWYFFAGRLQCPISDRSWSSWLCTDGRVSGLLQIQMRISFPFLLAKELRRFLLIMRTRSFYSPICRGYIRKVSLHLVHKYFPHDCSTDSISCSEWKKRNLMKTISKQNSDEI